MADEQQLTTEDYTHEEAIARITELEEAIGEALEALEAGKVAPAIEILDAALEEDEDEEEDAEDLEDDLEDDD